GRCCPGDHILGTDTVGELKDHDVGLDALRVEDHRVGGRENLGHGTSVGVVGGDVSQVLVEGMRGGGGEHPDLPHGSAQHPPVPAGPGYQVGVTDDHRSAGSTQCFGE